MDRFVRVHFSFLSRCCCCCYVLLLVPTTSVLKRREVPATTTTTTAVSFASILLLLLLLRRDLHSYFFVEVLLLLIIFLVGCASAVLLVLLVTSVLTQREVPATVSSFYVSVLDTAMLRTSIAAVVVGCFYFCPLDCDASDMVVDSAAVETGRMLEKCIKYSSPSPLLLLSFASILLLLLLLRRDIHFCFFGRGAAAANIFSCWLRCCCCWCLCCLHQY